MAKPAVWDRFSPGIATALYGLLAISMTWPLCLGLGRDIPWDLGDSILNLTLLQWGVDHLSAAATSPISAWQSWWNPGFFYPTPLVLAYSEHLLPQALLAWPIYAVTGNIIFAYNCVFLSTFVLAGLGVFLFVRQLTGHPGAAFVAGVVFAFSPYRIAQYSHLQVLSSQWMPFALYGFAKYAESRDWRWLVGGTIALWLNGLSCGYFLLYFSPFAAAYVLWDLWRRGGLWTWRSWADLAVAGSGLLVVTVPFLLPYARVRSLGVEPRPMAEVAKFSADVFAYATTHHLNRLWGEAAAMMPRAEGELFPGLLAVLLAGAGVIRWLIHPDGHPSVSCVPPTVSRHHRWREWLAVAAASVSGLHLLLLAVLVLGGRLSWRGGGVTLRVSSPGRTALIAAASAVLCAAASRRVRAAVLVRLHHPMFPLATGILVAFALSLGPLPTALGRPVADWGPYAGLMAAIPGFDGLRVPARFATIVTLFLACAAGYGVSVRRVRWPATLVAGLTIAVLSEAMPVPLQINATSPLTGVTTPQGPLQLGGRRADIYRHVAALPNTTILVEFPFGVEDYDMRYMLAATAHHRPILNGYSGGFPAAFVKAKAVLSSPLADPLRAETFLADSAATHAIVHEASFVGREGQLVSEWLLASGARLIATSGHDRLFLLRVDHPVR